MNYNNQCVAEDDELNQAPSALSTYFWTLFSGFVSCFLGGLCSIWRPPIIIYFLHPPHPIFLPNKKLYRATGAEITVNNFTMRFIHYLVNNFALNKTLFFAANDWDIYVFTPIFSMVGVMDGANILVFSRKTKRASRVYLQYL